MSNNNKNFEEDYSELRRLLRNKSGEDLRNIIFYLSGYFHSNKDVDFNEIIKGIPI